jgi:hypothetical protein
MTDDIMVELTWQTAREEEPAARLTVSPHTFLSFAFSQVVPVLFTLSSQNNYTPQVLKTHLFKLK